MTDNPDNRPRIGDPRPTVDPDPYGIMRPPSTAAEIAESNRLLRERMADERMARETTTANLSVQAAHAAREAVHGVQVSDGLVPGQRHPSPELPPGELGDAVRALVRWERAEGARSRARARIVVEQAERAEDDRGLKSTAAVLAQAALSAGAKRETVPPTWRPLVDAAIEAETAALPRTAELERMIFGAIDAQTIEAARNALRDALPEIDALVRETATQALQQATEAHRRLTLSGVTVDVGIDDAVDSGDDGVLAALRVWRSGVAAWEDAQTVRAWVAAADVRGLEITSKGALVVTPPPRVPSGQFAQADRIDAAQRLSGVEERTTTAPWQADQGSATAPSWLADKGSHAALRWWCGLTEGERPAPRGVFEQASQ